MKLKPEQLANQCKANLAHCYLISGDEPLLQEESLDTLRQAAKKQGYLERTTLTADTNADWERIANEMNANSLFASKRLLELRIKSLKFTKFAKETLQTIIDNPRDDMRYILITHKLEASTQRSKWVKAIEKDGVFVQIWPVDQTQFPHWIKQRLQKKGVKATPELIQGLAMMTEGNLLAAVQEIEKLALLPVKTEELPSFLYDAAKFSSFDFVGACLLANNQRALRILEHLKSDGTESILVLWAISQEIRLAAKISQQLNQGSNFNTAFKQNYVWPKRQAPLQQYIRRHKLITIYQHLQHCSKIDRTIKGQEAGDAWFELSTLTTEMTGATHTHA